MDKLKLFIRQKSAIRKLMSLTFLLTFLWMDFFVFGVIIGKPLTFAQAESTIRVGLRVLPSNPIENTEKIIPNNEKHESLSDLRSSSFRLISSVENTDKSLQLNETSQPGEKSDQVMESDGVVLGKSIVDFQGKAIYPNSNVLLEIRSSPFLTSVISDSQGNWTWTNWCHPLEDGEHWLEASNVSPFDLSGKRDIFIQRFKFFVKNQVDSKLTDQLALEKLISTAGTDGVADILGKGNVKDLYLFNIALLNKKEYNPQDEMFLQLLFNPLGQISDKEALIKYEIYGVDENGSIDQPLLELNDKIELAENKAFLKKIKLQKEITGNEYFIKVMAYIGGNEYVQSAKFGIAPKILLQVGEVKIDQDKFSKIIVWNSLVVVGFAIIVLLLMIFEYHQMSQSDLINAKMLKKRHYFS